MCDRPSTREAFNRALILFITDLVRRRSKATGKTFTEIDASTPLFESGLIDSLGILELLAFVEETIGSPIPILKIDMKFFATVDCISRSFWRDAREGEYGLAVPTVGASANRA